MRLTRVLLFPEPLARELKPEPSDLPPSITRQIEKTCGARVRDAAFVYGGLSVSAAFIFTLEDGRRVFAKGAHPGDTAHGSKNLAQEILVYECIGLVREISPPYLGLVSDGEEGGWMLGLWTCVEHDPSRASAQRAVDGVAAWQADGHVMDRARGTQEGARGLLPTTREHVYLSGILGPEKKWQRLCNDAASRGKFLGLFSDLKTAQGWFDRNAPVLARLQLQAGGDLGPEGLVHGDLRLDNFLFGSERTYIIDWPNASFGPLLFDAAFLFSNMEALGFGPAENSFKIYENKTGTSFALEKKAVIFSALSGYFADQAYRDIPPKMPRLRWMQKSMLLAQLNILARAGVIESPPSMIGQNQ